MNFVAHSGMGVTSLERSERFYCELLGFQHGRTLAMASVHVANFLQLKPAGGDLRAVYLYLGDFQLELIQFSPSGINRVRERQMNESGLTHISIGVESVAAIIARLQSLGGEFVSQIGERAALIRDPDGQFIEILEGAYAAEERKRHD